MKTSFLHKSILLLLILAPVIYLSIIYSELPDTVPLHYGPDMQPDRFGAKSELWLPIGILLGVAIISYLIITNISKIDPKMEKEDQSANMVKFGTTIVGFFSAISMYIIYSTQQGQVKSLFFILMGALFAVLGNLMYNIKPNYFIGMRLPWTLHDDENWKLTHRLAGKLWVVGGILICVFSIVIPTTLFLPFFIAVMLFITVWPMLFSFRFYMKKKKNF